MKKEVSVSVIVPVYNAEKYLEKCLNSIIEQTLENIEIIIIDDGSTDQSPNICYSFKQEDARISYYRKENEGLAAARQDGMELAKGKYIGFVDADDWIEPNMYERMYFVAEQEMADIVFCNCYFDEKNQDRMHLAPGVYDREAIEKEILPRSLAEISEKGGNSVIRWSNCLRLYRSATLKENKISFDRRFRRSQDLQLTFEATLHANKYVSITNEYLYHNRTTGNDNSLSRGYTKEYWNLICPLIERLYEDVNSYQKQNLKEQMDLCTFFFAATGVKNEYENKSVSIKHRINKLNEISQNAILQNSLQFVVYDRLSDYYKAIYNGLITKNGFGVYYYYFIYELRKNVFKPVARKLISNPYIRKIYKK